MLNNNLKENDMERTEKICDSPRNKSRVTIKYEYNPVTDLLGKGGYGEVYKVKILKNIPNNSNYAIKIFEKSNLYQDEDKSFRILNEIKIHRSLNHEHICKYEHSFEDKKNVYILMEYCEYGTLSSFLKTRVRFEEIEIRFYMFQVLLVLKYFRKQKIIHRDLTLGNIFLKDYKTVKIGDFGFAYRDYENEEKSGIICGTPGYFTPESNTAKYSYKTDIFDFGVCIYYLFGGKLPLQTSQQSYDLFALGELQFEKHIKLSEEALDLLKNTITIENKRLDLDKIFEHPFFKKGKGLSKDNFPDYNDKDYMEQIDKLTNEFDIKPMVRQNKKDKNIKDNKGQNSSSENSNDISHSFSDTSSKKNDGALDSSKSSHKNHSKNVTFNMNNVFYQNKGKNNKKSDIFRENLRKSLKDQNGIAFEIIKNAVKGQMIRRNSKLLNDKKIDFNNNTLGGENIENLENDSKNEENFYDLFKNHIKLDINCIIYITKIYDNLREYCGIGYELNNKNIGFIFNDDSQMTKLNDNLQYIFYHKKDINKNITHHTIINLPPKNINLNTENKLKFLWQIIEEFNKIKYKEKYIINNYNITNIEDDIYIVKYKKSRKGYFFILSNKSIQVNYFDGIKILFNYYPKGIAYFQNDKNNTVTIFPLNDAQNFYDVDCEDPFINSKIRYAIREIKK